MTRTSTASSIANTTGERAFFFFMTVVLLGAFGVSVFADAQLREPWRLGGLTALMVVHLGLHWSLFFGALSPNRRWPYLILQGALALAIALLSRSAALYYGVFLALIGESVGFFRGSFWQTIGAVAYLAAMSLMAQGLTLGWSDLGWWALASLPMTVFVIIYVTLYSRQAEARERAQQLARELETANRQLSEYAARVEDLTIANERQRIARELHDTLSQGLAGLILQLEAADAHLDHQRIDKARGIVTDAMTQARVTLADARRAIDDLRQTAPDALEATVCREVTRFGEATGLVAECRVDQDLEPPDATSEAVVRIVSEALTNVARHARARRVTVSVRRDGNDLCVTVSDDGVGFDPAAVPPGHYGLIGVRERTRLIGGRIELASRPGGGTTLTARLPLEAA